MPKLMGLPSLAYMHCWHTKNEFTYNRMFRKLVEIEPELNPSYIMVYFEKAAINALGNNSLLYYLVVSFIFPKIIGANNTVYGRYRVRYIYENASQYRICSGKWSMWLFHFTNGWITASCNRSSKLFWNKLRWQNVTWLLPLPLRF